MTRALLLVDVQLDYFPGGAFPLVAPEAAAEAAGAVLRHFRGAGEDVVHVFHTATETDAGFFVRGTPGVAFHPDVEPRAGEAVVEKHEPNSFLGTGLEHLLRDRGVTDLVVLGMMTSMCIDSTVRAASDLGFACTVVADACAAPDLALGDVTVPGATVHAAFLAALDGSFATVVRSADLLEH
ncbi:cysteine hydrolase family protein [Curtobacterium sp. NPDC089689]|uniref:cysteine hydrolase family protein n=1 Tax=Curtobacterium sp. NPDC089689 TaxID=3363968 RepID=UPI00380B4738